MDQRPVLSLREVLSSLPCPAGFTADQVSSKWQCRIAPMACTDQEMLHSFDQGVPCFGTPSQSQAVHSECASDGKHANSYSRDEAAPENTQAYPDDGSYINFVTNPKWSKFPSDKIAFHAGWAGPGTAMDAEKLHTMVGSWMDVLNSGGPIVDDDTTDEKENHPILNLQYFHRNDPLKDPVMPALASLLQWPSFLEPKQGGRICDTATRASKRGAVTWWHLDDCGEFVMQTGLAPTLDQVQGAHAVDSAMNTAITLQDVPPHLRGAQPTPVQGTSTIAGPTSAAAGNKVVPVKLFIYAPPESYGWFMHDRESEDTGKVTALHLFRSTDEQLPPRGYLPILNVAVLVAGGPPLVSPPNIPHMVISLNDCVMVEQRRCSDYFLDEVAHLLQMAKKCWGSQQPVMYHYLRVSLQDAGHVQSFVVKALVKKFNANYLAICAKRSEKKGSELTTPPQQLVEEEPPTFEELLNNRIFASLYAIDRFPDYFRLTENDRKALQAMFFATETSALAFFKHKTAEGQMVVKRAEYHWDVGKDWHIPCQVFMLNDRMSCAVVYDAGCNPVYGLPRPQVETAERDWERMSQVQEELNKKYKEVMGISGSDGPKTAASTKVEVDASVAVLASPPPIASAVTKMVVETDPLLDELF